jgi:hypothetical protein
LDCSGDYSGAGWLTATDLATLPLLTHLCRMANPLIEDIIGNTTFVRSLYGKIPDLNNIKIADFRLEELASVRLGIVVATPIAIVPYYWSGHNGLYCDLLFTGIDYVNFRFVADDADVTSMVISSEGDEFRCTLAGQIDASFSFAKVSFQNFAPARV